VLIETENGEGLQPEDNLAAEANDADRSADASLVARRREEVASIFDGGDDDLLLVMGVLDDKVIV